MRLQRTEGTSGSAHAVSPPGGDVGEVPSSQASSHAAVAAMCDCEGAMLGGALAGEGAPEVQASSTESPSPVASHSKATSLGQKGSEVN